MGERQKRCQHSQKGGGKCQSRGICQCGATAGDVGCERYVHGLDRPPFFLVLSNKKERVSSLAMLTTYLDEDYSTYHQPWVRRNFGGYDVGYL